jgi:hypothetical protein
MTKETALQITPLGEIEISATFETLRERDRLLELARGGKRIADGESAKRAAEILKEVNTFARGIEAARKATKEPVLDLGRRIDELAKELISELNQESKRVSGLIGAWQKEQNDKAEEARRQAWEEEQRIKREAEAKERAEEERLRKLEEDRLAMLAAEQAELDAKAARARSEKGRQAALDAKAEAERKAEEEKNRLAKQAIAEGLKRDEQTAIEIGKAHATAAVVQQAKPQGIAVRKDVEFEILDITELYEAAPYLVKLEPNTAALKSALKQLPEGKSLPGVKHWFTSKAITR